jgi:hypothetical protein
MNSDLTDFVEWFWDEAFRHRLYVGSVFVAFFVSALLTPLVRSIAKKWNLVDHPDNHRKLHDRVTPLGGGVAVAAALRDHHLPAGERADRRTNRAIVRFERRLCGASGAGLYEGRSGP